MDFNYRSVTIAYWRINLLALKNLGKYLVVKTQSIGYVKDASIRQNSFITVLPLLLSSDIF